VFGLGTLAQMKSKGRKRKKDVKAPEKCLMEVLREIEKAALGDENPTCVGASDKERDTQTQASDSRIKRRN
jgi:hypothetical protein